MLDGQLDGTTLLAARAGKSQAAQTEPRAVPARGG